VPLERNLAQFKDTSRLALWAAERSLGAEVLLVSARRQLLETTRANLFVVSGRGLETAPATRVLPGVARGLVLELARSMGVTVQLRAPSLRQRARWLEVFVSNALRGIRPVRRIDTLRFVAPSASSLTRRLQRGLDERMGLS
jgi:para-aminobenzoate synthetase/4-amino-4-deoxychorismate lyase